MKNKTSRVNKMKLKKAIVASLAIFILLAFTGCGTSSSLATTEHTKQENPSKTDSNRSVEPNEKLDDLFPTGKPDLYRSQKCMGQGI